MKWRLVSVERDGTIVSGVEVLVDVLNAQDAWGRLTRKQREAITHNLDGEVLGHPLTVKSLHRHGICDEAGQLTDAGRLLLKWGPS